LSHFEDSAAGKTGEYLWERHGHVVDAEDDAGLHEMLGFSLSTLLKIILASTLIFMIVFGRYRCVRSRAIAL
jgi:hypothetical protein